MNCLYTKSTKKVTQGPNIVKFLNFFGTHRGKVLVCKSTEEAPSFRLDFPLTLTA